MLKITLVPSISQCIETIAKKEYNDSLRQVLAGDPNSNTQKLELLKSFLETANFKKLRSESEKHLIAKEKVVFILQARKGVTKYEMRIN